MTEQEGIPGTFISAEIPQRGGGEVKERDVIATEMTDPRDVAAVAELVAARMVRGEFARDEEEATRRITVRTLRNMDPKAPDRIWATSPLRRK